MIFGELDSALSLWERLKTWWSGRTPPVETVAGRCIRLFETHGVHRNQIPRFFGHGLSLKDVDNEAALTAKLDEVLLDDVCAKFAVRREWLDGAESQAHPLHDFYTHSPEEFARFVDQLIVANPDGQLRGVFLIDANNGRESDGLLILQEIIQLIGEKPIYRFHLLNNWMPAYWKSRAYMTACVAVAWKAKVYIYGRKILARDIKRWAYGEELLGWRGDGMPMHGERWYPEDMALDPQAYLDGVDPEDNDFGIRSGLKLWLALDARGLMDIGLNEGVRPKFEERLKQLN